MRSPICVVPNGIDVPTAASPARVAGVPSDARILLYLGRINPKKGLPLLLESFGSSDCLAAVRTHNWHIVIGGAHGSQSRLFHGDGKGGFKEMTATHLPKQLTSAGDLEIAVEDRHGYFGFLVAPEAVEHVPEPGDVEGLRRPLPGA